MYGRTFRCGSHVPLFSRRFEAKVNANAFTRKKRREGLSRPAHNHQTQKGAVATAPFMRHEPLNRLSKGWVRASSGQCAVDKACYEQHDEYEGKELGDPCEISGKAAKTKDGCKYRQNEKCYDPVKHKNS